MNPRTAKYYRAPTLWAFIEDDCKIVHNKRQTHRIQNFDFKHEVSSNRISRTPRSNASFTLTFVWFNFLPYFCFSHHSETDAIEYSVPLSTD